MTPNPDGTYQLAIEGVDADVIAFTDRPNRDTGILTVPQMTKAWAIAFVDSAPNGVLVAHHLGAPADSIVAELFSPQFDGTTTTYTVRVLADENISKNIVGDTSTTQIPTPPATFFAASLFIDNFNLRYARLSEDGTQTEIYPPGDVPAGGPTQAWYAQCNAAGGSIGETFGSYFSLNQPQFSKRRRQISKCAEEAPQVPVGAQLRCFDAETWNYKETQLRSRHCWNPRRHFRNSLVRKHKHKFRLLNAQLSLRVQCIERNDATG